MNRGMEANFCQRNKSNTTIEILDCFSLVQELLLPAPPLRLRGRPTRRQNSLLVKLLVCSCSNRTVCQMVVHCPRDQQELETHTLTMKLITSVPVFIKSRLTVCSHRGASQRLYLSSQSRKLDLDKNVETSLSLDLYH